MQISHLKSLASDLMEFMIIFIGSLSAALVRFSLAVLYGLHGCLTHEDHS